MDLTAIRGMGIVPYGITKSFLPFDYLKIVADGNTWMLQGPMTNKKNAQ